MTSPILVLGGAGFVGRHLVEALAASGKSVIAATTKPAAYHHPAIENVVAPFNNPADFAPVLSRCRSVMHAASASTPGSTASAPLAELDSNLRVALSLLTALHDAPDCSLVYLSSGGTLYGDRHGEDAIENDMLLPRSYHGAAKASIEHFIHAWSELCDGAAVVLRPSNVYGPGQPSRRGFGIIPAAFDCIRQRSTLTLWGDGSVVRDYIYIDDFIRLCLAVLARPAIRGVQTYNAASGESVNLLQLLDAIQTAANEPLKFSCEGFRKVDIRHIVPSNAAVKEHYDWQPTVPLKEGLQHAWRWFGRQPDAKQGDAS